VAVPLYLRFIGPEGYGLIGFFTVLSSLLSIMDAGFSAAAGRELARADGGSSDESRRAGEDVRILERGFLVVAVGLGGVIVAAAPLITGHWLNVGELSAHSAVVSVRLMGVAFAMQFPLALYNGCLLGLQRHALLNGISSTIATARAVGAVLVLALVSPTVEAFFAWQAVVSLANLVIARAVVLARLPRPPGPLRFDLGRIRVLGRFAFGMGTINLLGLALSQLDKALLSFLLPLREFGYYMLAWALASLIYRLSTPLFSSVLPRMTQLVALGDRPSLQSLFQRAGQLMAVLVIPFSLFLATYPAEIVRLWTSSDEAARADRWVLAFLAVGTMMNALMQLPFAAQVAVGRLRPLVLIDIVSLIIFAPLIVVLTLRAGIVGAAASWTILNVGIFGAMIAVARENLEREQVRSWLVRSLATPALVGAVALAGSRAAIDRLPLERGSALVFALALAGLIAEALVMIAVPFVRNRASAVIAGAVERLRRLAARP